MVEEIQKVDRGERRKKKKGAEGEGYLQDLEKALTDFKTFTDSYVQQHSPAAMEAQAAADKKVADEMAREAAERDAEEEEEEEEDEEEISELSEEEEEEEESDESPEADLNQSGFDRMESEDPDDLSVPESTGEIIPVDEEENPRDASAKNAVRKRPRKT